MGIRGISKRNQVILILQIVFSLLKKHYSGNFNRKMDSIYLKAKNRISLLSFSFLPPGKKPQAAHRGPLGIWNKMINDEK